MDGTEDTQLEGTSGSLLSKDNVNSDAAKSDERNGTGTDERNGTGTDARNGTRTDERNGTGTNERNETGTDVIADPGVTSHSDAAKSEESNGTGTDERNGTGEDATADLGAINFSYEEEVSDKEKDRRKGKDKRKKKDKRKETNEDTGITTVSVESDNDSRPKKKSSESSYKIVNNFYKKRDSVTKFVKEKKGIAQDRIDATKEKYMPIIEPTGPVIMAVITLSLMVFDQTTDILTSNSICNVPCGCLWSIKPNGTVQCEVPGNAQEPENLWQRGDACYVTFGNKEMIDRYCNFAKNPDDCDALDKWVPDFYRHPKFCSASITTILGPNIISSTYLLYSLWLIGDEVLFFLGVSKVSSLLKYSKYILAVFWFLQILPYTWLILHLLIVIRIWRSKGANGHTMEEFEDRGVYWDKRSKRFKIIFTLLEDVPQLILHSIFIINSAITEEHSLVNSGIQLLDFKTCMSLATSSASIAFMLMAYKVRYIEEDMIKNKLTEDADKVKDNKVLDPLTDTKKKKNKVTEDADKFKDNEVSVPLTDTENEVSGEEEDEQTGVAMKQKFLFWFPSFISIGTRALVCSSYASSVVETFKLQTWTLLLPPAVAIGIFIVENLFIQGFTFMRNMVKKEFSLGNISDIKETIRGKLSFDETGIIKVLSFFFNADSIQSLSTSFSYLVFAILLHSVWISEVTSRETRVVFVVVQYLALFSFALNVLLVQMEEWKYKEKGMKGRITSLAYSLLLLLCSIVIHRWLHHPTLFDVYKKLYFPNTDEKTGKIITYLSVKEAFIKAENEEAHIDPVLPFHIYNLEAVIPIVGAITFGSLLVVIISLRQKMKKSRDSSQGDEAQDSVNLELQNLSPEINNSTENIIS